MRALYNESLLKVSGAEVNLHAQQCGNKCMSDQYVLGLIVLTCGELFIELLILNCLLVKLYIASSLVGNKSSLNTLICIQAFLLIYNAFTTTCTLTVYHVYHGAKKITIL